MSLERVFDVVEGMRKQACADAAFGKPQEVAGRVLIPVAVVSTGFGLGLGQTVRDECEEVCDENAEESDEGQATPESGEEQGSEPGSKGEGGGGGGGVRTRPIAVIEVTPEATVVRPIVDEGKVALAWVALMGWAIFWCSLTMRAIFGHRS